MPNLSRTRSIGLLLAIAAALAGCGQKGPLFLPTAPAAANRATLPQTLSPVSPAATPAAPAASATTGTASPIRIP